MIWSIFSDSKRCFFFIEEKDVIQKKKENDNNVSLGKYLYESEA